MTSEHIAWKGSIGVVSPLVGYMVSRLEEIEQWLRLLSLCGGLIVCAFTIRSFLKNWNK